jgi:hypothetical protein
MGCTDIHDCDRSAYYLALVLYKIQLEEIRHYEITSIVKELKEFGRGMMLKDIIITVVTIFVGVELIEHVIFPIGWLIFKGRKRSTYGVTGMIGKLEQR